MIYLVRYDFDNYTDLYDFDIFIRNGACFKFMNCIVKYYSGENRYVLFEFDNKNSLCEEDIKKEMRITIAILSYLFSVPFHENWITLRKSSQNVNIVNNLMSNKNKKILSYVESKVSRFNKGLDFFHDNLNLLMVANKNNFNENFDDSFFCYFKIIEKIAKQNYLLYMDRNYTKAVKRKNKGDIKDFIRQYSKDDFKIILTEEILQTKTDLFYKYLKTDLHNSIFSKISLLVNQKKINFDINKISELVKLRNKLAHGDLVEEKYVSLLSGDCESFALQVFSKYFFNKEYEELHIKSQRIFKGIDFWMENIKVTH